MTNKPEWKVTYTDGKVAIRSNNFTHDAVLYLTGDFATHEVAISYASKLVAKLNADLYRIEAETEARVLEKAIVACKGVNENRKAEHLVCVSDTVTQCVDAIRSLSFQCADGGHCGDGGYCDECPHRAEAPRHLSEREQEVMSRALKASVKVVDDGWVRVPVGRRIGDLLALRRQANENLYRLTTIGMLDWNEVKPVLESFVEIIDAMISVWDKP